MAHTRKTPAPRVPVSPSTSPAGTTLAWARRTSFSSSYTTIDGTATGRTEAPITPSSSCTEFRMVPGRRADSKALPSSRAATSSSTPGPTSVAEGILTMNDVIAKIPNLLPGGYYQCAGVSRNYSRCSRHVKNRAYCHSHDTQLREAVGHDKDLARKMIMEVKAHKGPINNKLAGIRHHLLSRNWTKIHISNFEGLLLNIKKGPLEASERDQGRHALVPRFDRLYVCRGRTQSNKCCRIKTVGAHYCSRHNPSKIAANDVEMAFASI